MEGAEGLEAGGELGLTAGVEEVEVGADGAGDGGTTGEVLGLGEGGKAGEALGGGECLEDAVLPPHSSIRYNTESIC